MNPQDKIKSLAKAISALANQSRNLKRKYPSAASKDEIIRRYRSSRLTKSISLDLGCGDNPKNPFLAKQLFAVDRRVNLGENIFQADLSVDPIPFDSNTFDYCTAFDFLEHIPRISWPLGKARNSLFELMNEIHRVLKPGGIFLHSTPAFPSKEAFQDPTHVNIITEDTMPDYFCMPNNWGKGYDIGFQGEFELLEQAWVDNIWIVGVMRAIK